MCYITKIPEEEEKNDNTDTTSSVSENVAIEESFLLGMKKKDIVSGIKSQKH